MIIGIRTDIPKIMGIYQGQTRNLERNISQKNLKLNKDGNDITELKKIVYTQLSAPQF